MHCYRCGTSADWVYQGGNVYKCPNCGATRVVGSSGIKPHHKEPEHLIEDERKRRASR
jgi:hypothetical protein